MNLILQYGSRGGNHEKEWEEIIILLKQLALPSKESESGHEFVDYECTMNAHEFVDYELEYDLNNSYIPTKEEIIGMLDGGGDEADNKPIEEVDNVQISDVVVDRVRFKDA